MKRGLTESPCFAIVGRDVHARSLFVLCAVLVVSCATANPVRTYPPRATDCEIELIEVSGHAAPGWTTIGSLSGPIASEDTDPLSPDAVDSGLIALPAGFTIAEMAATGEFLFLLVTDESGATLLLRLDPRDPAGAASFVVETARP